MNQQNIDSSNNDSDLGYEDITHVYVDECVVYIKVKDQGGAPLYTTYATKAEALAYRDYLLAQIKMADLPATTLKE